MRIVPPFRGVCWALAVAAPTTASAAAASQTNLRMRIPLFAFRWGHSNVP
jgi:hypothetical protein